MKNSLKQRLPIILLGVTVALMGAILPQKALAFQVSPSRTCHQPPANVDLSTLSDAQLIYYGLPPRPKNTVSLQAWIQRVRTFKTHVCDTYEVAPGITHLNIQPLVSEFRNADFAGNWATSGGSTASYVEVVGNWNIPCMNTSVRNARSSMWIGLGKGDTYPGEGGGSSDLPQSGTDHDVDANGHVTYRVWAENAASSTQHVYPQFSLLCGDRMFFDVYSDGSGSDSFEIDDLGQPGLPKRQSQFWWQPEPGWGSSNGQNAEWVVERHFGGGTTHSPLADFRYIQVTNAKARLNDSWINVVNTTHHYDTIYQGTQPLAVPRPIASNGTDFNIDWIHS